MELRHLKYFVTVAEELSVSKAAARLHVSQPALSRQIRDLEAELGLTLFDRVGRHIELTAHGEDLRGSCRDVLALAAAVHERARALRGGQVGLLRVGATPQLTQSLLAQFLARYRRVQPGIEVRLTEEGGVRLLELVEEGVLHLAVTGVIGGPHLESRPLFPIRVLAVRAPRSGRRRRTIDLAELATEPLLLPRRDFGTRQIFDAMCRIARLRPHVVMESGDLHSLVALAEAGHGVAVVPSTLEVARRLEVLPILVNRQSLGIWGGVAWDPRRSLPVYATGFVKELAEHVRRGYPGSRFDRGVPPVQQQRDGPR
jgi:LysR family transcriptional regulator, cyn operon transcriptional activator